LRTLVAVAVALVAMLAAGSTSGALAGQDGGTPTPVPDGWGVVRVIHDLNGDGIAQPNEPGLEGWDVLDGCSDAIGSLTTDEHGTAGVQLDRDGPVCLILRRQFGWWPTTPTFVEHPADSVPGEITFLVHDLRPSVMEVAGELIVAGLPASADATLALAPPYAHCLESTVERSLGDEAASRKAVAFVVGDDARPGCPSSGDVAGILLDGEPGMVVAFMEGQDVRHPLVAGGDSMRFYATRVSGAHIEGSEVFECGVVVTVTEGFVPADFVRVFVLSDEVRSGCGVEGSFVRLYRNGALLNPLVPWVAGAWDDPLPDFIVAPQTPPVVIVPQTGSAGAGQPQAGGSDATWLLALFFIPAIAALLLASRIWTTRRER
jgi:hypothetical protein